LCGTPLKFRVDAEKIRCRHCGNRFNAH
jgi:DNA-directed RNA polymerase subunit RPC12/RpoP